MVFAFRMKRLFKPLAISALLPLLLLGCATHGPQTEPAPPTVDVPLACARVLKAEVVALEQAVVLNCLGAFNPAGMLYALREDVVLEDGSALTDDKWSRAPGHVQLRSGKRARPLVLRANEGDCLEVTLHNLLAPAVDEQRSGGPALYGGKVVAHGEDPPGVVYPKGGRSGRELVTPTKISNDLPFTRGITFHVTGLEYQPITAAQCPLSSADRTWVCGHGQGDVGRNISAVHPATPEPLRATLRATLRAQGGTAYPGQSAVYRFRAQREGTYFAYSNAATVGGEGDGGQLGLGLFSAVNVQPKDSTWYRSQVTHDDLKATTRTVAGAHPYHELDYDNARYTSGPRKGAPILPMLDGDRIVHSDLNAVVVPRGTAPDHGDTTSADRKGEQYAHGHSCGKAYREFTVILHDEVQAVQAFAELEDENNPLSYLKDGMGINYGTGGMGAMVIARNCKTGPARDCPECRAEEFFLSSWVNGDPALVLQWDAAGKTPVGAMYPDDPSNVHHSYLNDPVRFRNLHAGPKETHVFHLHAHQWVMDVSQPGSSYLDSQTISPGATFSYEISFGGSGNKNLSPGDSIFHCHLYPHFAQGMWELWRVHDVFEDGTPGLFDKTRNPRGRNLPDAEVKAGIDNPALVPLPGTPLPPMPTVDFRGYPFFAAAEAGHRPPQPPYDMDDSDGQLVNGGLPRHHLSSAKPGANRTKPAVTETRLVNQDVVNEALSKGGLTARINAAKVYAQNPNALTALAEVWEQIGSVQFVPHAGSASERTAMDFHEGVLNKPGFQPATPAAPPSGQEDWTRELRGYRTEHAASVAGQTPPPAGSAVFLVNGRHVLVGNVIKHQVSLVDLAQRTVCDCVDVPPWPDQITSTRDFAYVRSQTSATVTMFGIERARAGKLQPVQVPIGRAVGAGRGDQCRAADGAGAGGQRHLRRGRRRRSALPLHRGPDGAQRQPVQLPPRRARPARDRREPARAWQRPLRSAAARRAQRRLRRGGAQRLAVVQRLLQCHAASGGRRTHRRCGAAEAALAVVAAGRAAFGDRGCAARRRWPAAGGRGRSASAAACRRRRVAAPRADACCRRRPLDCRARTARRR